MQGANSLASIAMSSLVVLVGLVVAGSAGAQRTPVIKRIEPSAGPPGTLIHIVGRNFGPEARVRIGEVALELESRMPSRLGVRITPGVAGGPVRVETAAGVATGPGFRLTEAPPPPVIERMEPTAGPPGSRVTLYGRNFAARLGRNRVRLGSMEAMVYSASPLALVVTVPSGARSGVFSVSVVHAGEVDSPPFEVEAGTRVDSVEPVRAVAGGTLAILGAGFSTAAPDNRVFLADAALKVESATRERLEVRLPRRIRSGVLLVDVKGAGRAQLGRTLQVQRTPIVEAVEPVQGPAGTRVTLTGRHFGDDPATVKATVGGVAAVVHAATATRMILEVPASATTGRIAVTVGGVGPARSAEPFQVLAPPLITGFRPSSGPAGTVVAIRGSGFARNPTRNRVTIGDVPVEVLKASTRALRVRIPAAASGLFTVEHSEVGAGRASDPFVVTTPPTIATVEPQAATVGSDITIRGTGFGDRPAGVRVELSDRRLRVRSVSDDTLVVRLVAGARTGALRVTVPLEGSVLSSQPLRVLQNLVAGRATPRRVAPGDTVRIGGRGFVAEGTRVEFTGGALADARVIDDGSLEVVVPQGAASGLATVILADGRRSPTRTTLRVAALAPVADGAPDGDPATGPDAKGP